MRVVVGQAICGHPTLRIDLGDSLEHGIECDVIPVPRHGGRNECVERHAKNPADANNAHQGISERVNVPAKFEGRMQRHEEEQPRP